MTRFKWSISVRVGKLQIEFKGLKEKFGPISFQVSVKSAYLNNDDLMIFCTDPVPKLSSLGFAVYAKYSHP